MKSGGGIFLSMVLVLASGSGWTSRTGAAELSARENETARLATFESATGQTSFALSLVPTVAAPEDRASDVLILVDTSASQSGLYQRDSLAMVNELLARLNRTDRVRIAAVDLEVVQVQSGTGFAAPDAAELRDAVVQVAQRAPLGSTDIAGMLRQIPALMGTASAGRNQSVIYIGDGVSRAGLLHDANFGALVQELARRRISFSSYAIGPERDIETLAAISNLTGGNLFLDNDSEHAVTDGASQLVATVHGNIFWPGRTALAEPVREIYPRQVPPLRFDRDSIVVGTLSSRDPWTLEIDGELAGQAVSMSWSLSPEQSSDEFSFLPQLLDVARTGAGLKIPLLGSGGLREAALAVSSSSRTLTQLGTQALVMGNASSARELASAALERDASNTEAELLLEAARAEESGRLALIPAAVRRQEPADIAPGPVAPGQGQPALQAQQGTLQLIGPSSQDDEIRRLVQESRGESSAMMTDEQDLARVRTGRMRAQVQYELTRATEELRTDPGRAVERLKSVLEVLDQTADIDPSARVELRSRLESSLASARQRKLDFDAAEALRQQQIAAVNTQLAAQQALATREEEISRRLNRFSDLLREGNYDAAEESALAAYQLAPELPEANAAYQASQLASNYYRQIELNRRRQVAFLDTMYETELSSVPFSGNPPLVFPDREFWQQAKALRQKYNSVRLSGNPIDEEILRQLDKMVDDFIFQDTPFSEVMVELKSRYNINIVLDTSAREDALTEDTSVNIAVSGIRLKNALRLLLSNHNATFVVKDEVLRIISKDVASDAEFFVTNIYNVGDLIAPRRNAGGGMMGGMMGGMGGGMGGMGGGMGGMGGGMGGMGGMGGGMGGMGGGMFCVQDDSPVAVSRPVEPAAAAPPADRDWNAWFSTARPAPDLVRGIVRDLMDSGRPAEVVEVLQAAIRHGQIQPWMFEGMAIAMEIAGSSRSDIERAVMSAIDFSERPEDLLVAARYLAGNGMEKRAIQLLQDIALIDDSTPEVYVLGLRAATRIDDLDGIRWATNGILSQAWPKHRDVFSQALVAAADLQKRYAAAGRQDELAAFRAELDAALSRDVIIEVAWTGDADLDLIVEEPGGSICSRLQPRSAGGGVLMGDAWSRGNAQNGEFHEYYVLPRGFSGDYRAVVRRVSGRTTGDRATVTIYGHFNSGRQVSETKQVTVGEKGTMVLFSLAEGRRTVPVSDRIVQRIADEQFMVGRKVLAQQLGQPVAGTSLSEYLSSRRSTPAQGNGSAGVPEGELPPGALLRPGMVGYTPIITQFFEGSTLTVGHATTSDRLHVLISATPFFSGVTEVTTFNILGNSSNATGTGGGLGGGGGAGLGGGLGGGGF